MDTHDDTLTDVRTIKASEFKAKCLKLMDEVADSGVEIVITKNGHLVSRLVPYRKEKSSMFGRNRDQIRILGDIISPLKVDWDEERDWRSSKEKPRQAMNENNGCKIWEANC